MQKWSSKGSWFVFALFALWGWAKPAAADVSIWLRVPTTDDLMSGTYTFSDSLGLMVVVNSTSAVVSVEGSLSTLEFELVGSPSTGYEAVVSTVSLAQGLHPLIVTATNEAGEQAVLEMSLMCDRPPAVSVTSPSAGSTVSGPFDIDATCTDDGPDACSSLLVVYSQSNPYSSHDPQLASLVACGADGISGTYNLSRFAGTSGWLHFFAYTPTGPGGAVAAVPITVTGSAAGSGAVTVSSPAGGAVARPTLDIAGDCEADCDGMYVWYQREAGPPIYFPLAPDYRDIVACGPAPLAQTIDLSRYEGSHGWLVFASVHDPQRTQAKLVPIAVESSPQLCEVERVVGRILDADLQRVLLVSPDLTDLQLYDRVTHQYQTLDSAEPISWWRTSFQWARLTPYGAVFNAKYSQLWEARGDALVLLSTDSWDPGQAAGEFVLWSEGSGLQLRDLAAQATYNVADTAGAPHLAANGDVVFTDAESQVVRYRQGALDQLTFDDATKRNPLTDGTLVVYEKKLQTGRVLALLSGGQETIVDEPDPATRETWDRHALSSGWIAYTRSDEPGVFLREPDGTSHQLTDVPALYIDMLSERGQVMVSGEGKFDPVAGTISGRRLLTRDASVVDPASAGTPLFIDGHAHMAVAGSLFRVTTTGDCSADGGAGQPDPDAGLADAGLAEAGAGDAEVADTGVGVDPDADVGGAEDAASDSDVPATDAASPSELDASDAHDAAMDAEAPSELDASDEHDAAMEDEEDPDEELDEDAPPGKDAGPDAGRRRKRHHDADCSVDAPGAPVDRSGRPALASLGLLFALASWTRARRRRGAARLA